MTKKIIITLALLLAFSSATNYTEMVSTQVMGVYVTREKNGLVASDYNSIFIHAATISDKKNSLQLGFIEELTIIQFKVGKNDITEENPIEGVMTTLENMVKEGNNEFKKDVYINSTSTISPIILSTVSGNDDDLKSFEEHYKHEIIGENSSLKFSVFNQKFKMDGNDFKLENGVNKNMSEFVYELVKSQTEKQNGKRILKVMKLNFLSPSGGYIDHQKNTNFLFGLNVIYDDEIPEWKRVDSQLQAVDFTDDQKQEKRISNALNSLVNLSNNEVNKKNLFLANFISEPFKNLVENSIAMDKKLITEWKKIKTKPFNNDSENQSLEFKIDNPNHENNEKLKMKASLVKNLNKMPDSPIEIFEKQHDKPEKPKDEDPNTPDESDKPDDQKDPTKTTNKPKGKGGTAIIVIIVILLIVLVGVIGYAFYRSKQLSGKHRTANRRIAA